MAETETDIVELWRGVMSHLTTDSRITPQLWGFLDLVEPRGVMAGVLYLEVPNELTRGMLEQRVRLPLLSALEGIEDSEINSFAIVVNPDIESDVLQIPADELGSADVVPERPDEPPVLTGQNQSRLNNKYSFDNFVIGSSNRFSHAAAVAVAEAPAKAYNPLFIYGGSGLGKTHLLHAIGHYAQNLFKGIRVRYVSSEEFTNDFINAIANNRGPEFQSRYREIDILLIDDIQFLQGKDSTQEAFFHTFNTLHDHNKQVVVTSDLPPKQLTGFEDRMRSRFEWGLITDVQAPDLETRIAILRKKLYTDGIEMPEDVVEYLAYSIHSSVRELEGALISLLAQSSLNKKKITVELAKQMIDKFVKNTSRELSIDYIQKVVCDYFDMPTELLKSKTRKREIVQARQLTMFFAKQLTKSSLATIGAQCGNKDHATVLHACRTVNNLSETDKRFRTYVDELRKKLTLV